MNSKSLFIFKHNFTYDLTTSKHIILDVIIEVQLSLELRIMLKTIDDYYLIWSGKFTDIYFPILLDTLLDN